MSLAASRAGLRSRAGAPSDENAPARSVSRLKAPSAPAFATGSRGGTTRASSTMRASSTLRRPLADASGSGAVAKGVATPGRATARVTAAKPAAMAAAPPPPPASSLASSAPASALARAGLPSVVEAAHDAFAEGLREATGCDFDYKPLLTRKLVKKEITMNFKDHDALVKAQFEELKAAFSDLIQRRNLAIDRLRDREDAIAQRFAEASKLAAKLAEMTAAKASSDARATDLMKQLEQAKKDIEVVTSNQREADDEVDEANRIISGLNEQIAELNASIAEMQEKLEEANAINQGLEDDKEELKTEVTKLKTTVAEANAQHTKELAALQGNAAQATSSAGTKIAALTHQVAELSEKLGAAEKALKELERSNSLLEIDVTRAHAERDAAIAARTAISDEFERFKKQQDASQANIVATMDNFTKNQALHIERERDLSRQVDSALERLASMTAERDTIRASEASLRVDLREANSREAKLTQDLATMTATANAAQQECGLQREQLTRIAAELSAAQALHEAYLKESTAAKDELIAQLNSTQSKLATAEDKLTVAAAAHAAWDAKEHDYILQRDELLAARAAAEDTIATLTNQLETLRESAGATEESQLNKLCAVSKEAEGLRRRVREMAELKARMAEAEALVARMKEQVFEGDLERRRLHNLVQELKGNIRVFVRVRPFLPGDAEKALVAAVGADDDDFEAPDDSLALTPAISTSADGSSLDIIPPPPRGTKEGPARREQKPLAFTFDTVFGQCNTQEDVFNEVSFLVQSALDGYNVCLFSYGQTGSGKTFTMQGGQGDAAGLIPRSVKQILDTAARMQEQGWEYSLEVSFLEIYNETLRDLLRLPKAGAKPGDDTPLAIHQDSENVDVPGLTRVAVQDAETIDVLLARAEKRRSVAATHMNERSSRSHQVFALYIAGSHAKKGIRVSGQLNLVDLAGSERLARSGAEGDRKKEAAAINKSLSCLADVFTALAKKAPHVPFRNSKLTQLLQPCFRGEGKTLMMVNLSPTLASAQESLCSLRFAAQVAQVELGKAKKRVAEAPAIADAVPSSARPTAENEDADDYCAESADADGDSELMLDELEASTDMIALDSSRVAADAGTAKAGTKRHVEAMSASTTGAHASKPAGASSAAKPGTSFVARVRDAAAAQGVRRTIPGAASGTGTLTRDGATAIKKARTLK